MNSTGTATVTGTDSEWNTDFFLHVGETGTGTLNVEAGGLVSNADGTIGINLNSTGTVTVPGADSQWNNGFDRMLNVEAAVMSGDGISAAIRQ